MFRCELLKVHSWWGRGLRVAAFSVSLLAAIWGGVQASETKIVAQAASSQAKPTPTSSQKTSTSLIPAEQSKNASENGEAKKLSQKALGIQAYARLQVLIEYYFMESGLYPVSLKTLEHSFNVGLPADAPKVILGNDPLSGKPFVYTVSKDRRHYTLALPEPAKYGSDIPSLETIDWGWLLLAAEGKRIERLLSDCTRNINELATACEIYAKDHNKAFPAKLEALRPQYMFRELRCPASGKPYVYVFRRGGYTLECPEANKHGLGAIKYDSDKGLFVTGADGEQAKNAHSDETSSAGSAKTSQAKIKK